MTALRAFKGAYGRVFYDPFGPLDWLVVPDLLPVMSCRRTVLGAMRITTPRHIYEIENPDASPEVWQMIRLSGADDLEHHR